MTDESLSDRLLALDAEPTPPTKPPKSQPRGGENRMAREMRIGVGIILGLLGVLGGVLYYRIDSDAKKAAALKAKLELPGNVADAPAGQAPSGAGQAPPGQLTQFESADPGGEVAAIASAIPKAGEPNDAWSAEASLYEKAGADEATAPATNVAGEASPQELPAAWSVEPPQSEPAPEAPADGHVAGKTEPMPPLQFSHDAANLNFDDQPSVGDEPYAVGATEDAAAAETNQPAAATDLGGNVAPGGEPGLLNPAGSDEPAPFQAQPDPNSVAHESMPVEPAAPGNWGRRQPEVAPAQATEANPYANPAQAPEPTPAATPGRPAGFGYDNAQQAFPSETSQQRTPVASDTGVFDQAQSQYTVGPNENFWSISKRLYGSGAYFKALYEHNRRNYPSPNQLQPGDVISAPSAQVLQQTYPRLCPKPAAAGASSSFRPASARVGNGERLYTVSEGDSLFNIAKYELGQASRWAEIYELNREQLGADYNRLKPGTQLVLPGMPREDRLTEAPTPGVQR